MSSNDSSHDAPDGPRGAVRRPRVSPAVDAVTRGAFTALARVRRARPFHPVGRSFTALLVPGPADEVDVFGSEPRPALVRFSNAAGLPPALPDVLGIAVRVPDGAGPGRPVDLLLSSSPAWPVARHVLRPSRDFTTAHFSSLLPYDHAPRDRERVRRVLGARYGGPRPRGPLRLADLERAAAAGGLRFFLEHATPSGPWRPFAEIVIERRLPPEESERLRFHPWNAAVELRPAGLLNRIRAGAYEASQRTATSE